ncbi:MAG: hypothetical protein WCP46_00270 [Alphaproteobacteria bacterium]
MSRKVIVASAKTNAAVRINDFAGVTFGDLKANSAFAGIYNGGDGVEVVVKPGNITLRGDDSILPTEDFNVFIIATKNKAGITDSDANAVGTAIAATIKATARIASAQETAALKAALTSSVESFFTAPRATIAVAEVVAPVVDEELAAALAEAKKLRS